MRTNTSPAWPSEAEFDQMIASSRVKLHQALDLEARPWWRKLSRMTVVTVVVFSAGGVAGGAYAASQALSPAPEFSVPTGPPKPGEKVAKDMPTAPPEPGVEPKVGVWAVGESPPDLVPVILKDGREGFLRTYDMAYGSFNPKFTRKTGPRSNQTVLPVYAEDGQTVIGEWVAGTASWK